MTLYGNLLIEVTNMERESNAGNTDCIFERVISVLYRVCHKLLPCRKNIILIKYETVYLLIRMLDLIAGVLDTQAHPPERPSVEFQDMSVIESLELIYDPLFEICNRFRTFHYDRRFQQTL